MTYSAGSYFLRYLFRGSCLLFLAHTLLGLYSPYFRAYQDLLPPNFFWDWEVMVFSTVVFPFIIFLEIGYYYYSKGTEISPIALDAVFVGVWVMTFWLMVAIALLLRGPWSI